MRAFRASAWKYLSVIVLRSVECGQFFGRWFAALVVVLVSDSNFIIAIRYQAAWVFTILSLAVTVNFDYIAHFDLPRPGFSGSFDFGESHSPLDLRNVPS